MVPKSATVSCRLLFLDLDRPRQTTCLSWCLHFRPRRERLLLPISTTRSNFVFCFYCTLMESVRNNFLEVVHRHSGISVDWQVLIWALNKRCNYWSGQFGCNEDNTANLIKMLFFTWHKFLLNLSRRISLLIQVYG